MSERAASGRLPLALLAGGSGGFARDRRFERHVRASNDARGQAADGTPDPVGEAYAQGYADGAQAATEAERAQAAALDGARHRIETALARMDAEALTTFGARLRQTVLALCDTVLTEAAIDPVALARRVDTATAMFARADDERVIRLHPEDLALVHGRLPEAWHCEPDPSLDRGALRIETAQGGVEDGLAQWRAALEEALRAC